MLPGVQLHDKMSETCQLPPEGMVTLHLYETQRIGVGTTQVKDQMFQSTAQLGWASSIWTAPQTKSSDTPLFSCLTHHRNSATAF